MDDCIMSNKNCDAGRWVLNEQKFQLTSHWNPVDVIMLLFIDVAAATMWGSIYLLYLQIRVKQSGKFRVVSEWFSTVADLINSVEW